MVLEGVQAVLVAVRGVSCVSCELCEGAHLSSSQCAVCVLMWTFAAWIAIEAMMRASAFGSSHCPGREPPFSAVTRPARPYKTAIQNRFKVGNAEGA